MCLIDAILCLMLSDSLVYSFWLYQGESDRYEELVQSMQIIKGADHAVWADLVVCVLVLCKIIFFLIPLLL